MNAAALSQLSTDAANLMSWNGDTLLFKGVSYPCTIGRITQRTELAEGGLFSNYAGRVIIRAADFTTLPKPGEWVTVSGAEYLVGNVGDGTVSGTVAVSLEHGEAP